MTWERVDLSAEEFKRPSEPPAVCGLLYSGKRHAFSGPPESVKTLAALILALEHMRAKLGKVALIDFEMGPNDIRLLLSDLGATDEEITSVYYVNPDAAPTEADLEAIVQSGVTLAIIDAAAGAYDASGLDDNKRADAEKFSRCWIEPLWKAEVATIVLDHVVKNSDNRGKFAIGSERKLGGVDVHLGFEAITELTRGGRGLYKITTHKDRPGWLPRGRAVDLEIVSEPTTHALTWTFKPAHSTDPGQPDDGWRPTEIMERLSRVLELQNAPISRTTLANSVQGKRHFRFKAIDYLILDGYAKVASGGNITSVKAYRNTDNGSPPSKNDSVPEVPTVPSGSRNGSQAAGDPSGSQVPRSSIEREPGTSVAELAETLRKRHPDIAGEDDEPGPHTSDFPEAADAPNPAREALA